MSDYRHSRYIQRNDSGGGYIIMYWRRVSLPIIIPRFA